MITQKQLHKAITSFKEEIDKLALDERDLYPSFQGILEKIINRNITEEELAEEEIASIINITDKICDAADYVAYQNRAGNKLTQASANLTFQTELNKI